MERPYQFYYSLYCKYCRNLCQQLFADAGLANRFAFVNADRSPRCRGMMVPTLVVDGKRHTGPSAFSWLSSRMRPAQPACFDFGTGGIEFSELDGPGETMRSRSYCALTEAGASPITALAAGQHAPVMDARVARLIRAREQQLPRACGRVG